jgi:hypothetical protein
MGSHIPLSYSHDSPDSQYVEDLAAHLARAGVPVWFDRQLMTGDRVDITADESFEHPRLDAIYDVLDSDRSDLAMYLNIVDTLGGHSVLDIGYRTGTFALLLADRGRGGYRRRSGGRVTVCRASQVRCRAWVLDPW